MQQVRYKLGEFGDLFRNKLPVNQWSQKGLQFRARSLQERSISDAGLAHSPSNITVEKVVRKSSHVSKSYADLNQLKKDVARIDSWLLGIPLPVGRQCRQHLIGSHPSSQLNRFYGRQWMVPYFVRTLASDSAAHSSRQTPREAKRKDISTIEDPFDAPTYNIPEKPVTFTEGASYTIIILAGLGIAAAAAYAVFKELIFEPKEYKIFGKALERVQNDSQIRVRIGSPVTGYGQESRNRAARQRIPNRTWTDEDGIEHVEVNFYIRGPHGAGKVYAEMFKDKTDKKWKFTYLIVDITSPSAAQLMLESYVPA